MGVPKFVILDFETTGQTPGPHEIIEIGAVLVEGMLEVARYETLVRPHSPIPLEITRLTGITNEMVATAPRLEEVAAPFLEFLGDYPIVAHNNAFEQAFLDHFLKPLALDGKTFETHNTIDPIALVLPEAPSLSLENLRRRAGVDNRDAHRALKDSIDTLKVLEYVQDILKKERPQIARIALDTLGDGYWWHWFFNEAATQGGLDLTSAPGDELGDLKELRNEDKTKEIDWAVDLPESAIHETLQGADGKDGFQYREAQEVMSREIFTALTQGQKKAIEAPTGTGKSMAYLLPGYLVAEKTGAPLVVSTHSKSLQDQLLEKDIPRLGQILGREVHATAVKGQENYLCLRKLHELVDSLKENNFEGSTQEELWCTTYLLAYASVSPLVEVNRVSYYLRTLFPPFNSVLDQVRSHHSTTIGPKCPFYKRCHFFNSARKAHQSEVIVANHSLTFQWPAHLPQIRNIIFDEAHHLEDQITEAYTVEMTENAITELTRRLTRKSKNKRAKSELGLVASLFLNLKLSLEMSDRNHRDDLEALAKTIQDKLADVNARFVAHTKAAPASDWETIINLSMTPAARTQGLTDGLRGLHDAVKAMADYLGHAHRALEQEKRREAGQLDLSIDLLTNYYEHYFEYQTALAAILDDSRENWLRLLFWEKNKGVWRLEVNPIEVQPLTESFFKEKRSVVLTSATLSTGASTEFVTSRIGFKPDTKLISLPSPYPLHRQAVAYIPGDVRQPGTPEHLEALIDFTEQTTLALQGRTLLLITSNFRLRKAADELRARLEPQGIQVFDALSDSRAAELFRNSERALLIGSEKYGEGLDIPGRALSCVIVEKINEAMTRGPLAEARKEKTKFALFDYDFPLRMMWLRQRVGRLIRSATDQGYVVVFDPRYHNWSPGTRTVVHKALAPIPIKAGTRDQILADIQAKEASLSH